MKKLLVLFILFSLTIFSQETEGLNLDVVDEVPVYPGCEEAEKSGKIICFQHQIDEYVKMNFRVPPQRANKINKVDVDFMIDKDGSIKVLKVSGGNKKLRDEAKRVFKFLPNMTPGILNGKKVKCKFTYPIVIRT